MILHVITTLDPGGAEHALVDLVRGLSHRGWQQQVVYLKGNGQLTPVFQDIDVTVHKIPFENMSDVFSCRETLNVHTQACDLVHSHLLKANTLAALSSGPRPLIGSRHNDEAILNRFPVGLIHRFISHRESRHIAISTAVRDFYTGHGLCENKFHVIPYGYESQKTTSSVDWTTEFNISPETPKLLHAGRLVEQKGQHVLLQALTTWPEAHLVVCGEGPLEGTLKQLAQELGIDQRVTFTGFRDDLLCLMKSADLFVLPSLWEGLGRVLLESMDTGLPIVASRISAIPDVLGDTGFLCAPGDAEDLARVLQNAWNERQSRSDRANAMARRLQDHFSMSSMLDRHESLYRSLLDV